MLGGFAAFPIYSLGQEDNSELKSKGRFRMRKKETLFAVISGVVMRGWEDKGDKSAVHMGINEHGGSIVVVPVSDLGGALISESVAMWV